MSVEIETYFLYTVELTQRFVRKSVKSQKKKKMQYGGTANQMSAKKPAGQQMPREDRKSKNVEPAMGMPKMAGGGKAMLGDLDKDGKMSGYEKARQTAINKNMNKNKPKSA